jgi:membrane protein
VACDGSEVRTTAERGLPVRLRQRARALHRLARHRVLRLAGPGTRVFAMAKRWWVQVYNDGFIHAGNFAYMALISLFPFFIAASAIVSFIGEQSQREEFVEAVLVALPASVSSTLGPVALDVIAAREGWLLWVGGLVGLWTTSSLIETIRDVVHRSYEVEADRPFWAYRLSSVGLIFGSVSLLLLAFGAQVATSAIQQFLYSYFPKLDGVFSSVASSLLVSVAAVFVSFLVLFRTLSPAVCHGPCFPKWPGALFIASWWVVLIVVLPDALRMFFSYDLTYGSLAGVMIALFFFWLVGLGVVMGAALNAVLATEPRESEASAAVFQTGR